MGLNPPIGTRLPGGAPLDDDEAALLAELRERGLPALAEIAYWCFAEGLGDATQALAELKEMPQLAPAPTDR